MPKGRRNRANPIKKHPLYSTWRSMRRRCSNPNVDHYERYGGRGIKVCDRWINGAGEMTGFECFLADVGPRPPGHTLDRINNDGNYEPGNVRWATQTEQMMNSSVMAGRTLNFSELARQTGLSATTIRDRLDRGLSLEEALAPAPPNGRRLTPEEVAEIRRTYVRRHPTRNTRALAKRFGVHEKTVRNALARRLTAPPPSFS